MSKYTTEIRFICESYYPLNESAGYNSIDNIIKKTHKKIFDFDYPIFNENYRDELEYKIINHFYFREIGFETVGLFKHFLCVKLNEIMPKYNKLYEVWNKDLDLISNYSELSTSNRNSNATKNSLSNNESSTTNENNYQSNGSSITTNNGNTKIESSERSNTNRGSEDLTYNLTSDTPQGGLSGVDNMNYLSQAVKNNKNSNENSNNNSNTSQSATNNDNTNVVNEIKNVTNDLSKMISNLKANETNIIEDNDITKRYGYNGKTVAELLDLNMKLLKTIDELVINELNDLFMNIW